MEELKNFYSYKEFVNEKNKYNIEEESINEGIFGALGKGIKFLYDKTKQWANKVKGVKEVDAIYKKYLDLIDAEIKKQAGVDLQLSAEELLQTNKKAANAPKDTNATNAPKTDANAPKPTNASYQYGQKFSKLNEEIVVDANSKKAQAEATKPEGEGEANSADETNKKTNAQQLVKKQEILKKIIKLQQDKALREMTDILKRMGGAEKNPKLSVYINNKKDEFLLAFYNAQIKYCEEAGDTTMINKWSTERNKLQKDLEQRYDLSKAENVTIKVGDKDFTIGKFYRYNKDDGTIGTIKIIGASQTPDKIKAAYTSGDSKDKEQEFTAKNIDTEFKPEVDRTYKYYSDSANEIINVEVLEIDEKNKTAKVKREGENKDPFNIEYNKLLDRIKGMAEK